jgi:hypothetical protein
VGDAGNYMPYDPAKHEISSVVGRVHGIEHLYPIRDFADRVRTAFERHESQIGPMKDRNPVTGLMGGSATRGIPYQVSVGTNGLFRKYIDQGKAAQLVADVDHEAIYSTVLIRILL